MSHATSYWDQWPSKQKGIFIADAAAENDEDNPGQARQQVLTWSHISLDELSSLRRLFLSADGTLGELALIGLY
jgi:hypothetical protein